MAEKLPDGWEMRAGPPKYAIAFDQLWDVAVYQRSDRVTIYAHASAMDAASGERFARRVVEALEVARILENHP